jgi:hypothetical protein
LIEETSGLPASIRVLLLAPRAGGQDRTRRASDVGISAATRQGRRNGRLAVKGTALISR